MPQVPTPNPESCHASWLGEARVWWVCDTAMWWSSAYGSAPLLGARGIIHMMGSCLGPPLHDEVLSGSRWGTVHLAPQVPFTPQLPVEVVVCVPCAGLALSTTLPLPCWLWRRGPASTPGSWRGWRWRWRQHWQSRQQWRCGHWAATCTTCAVAFCMTISPEPIPARRCHSPYQSTRITAPCTERFHTPCSQRAGIDSRNGDERSLLRMEPSGKDARQPGQRGLKFCSNARPGM